MIRSDLNAPRDDEGRITNEKRLVASVPAIRLALDAGAAVMVMSHLGRPANEPDPKYSLAPVAKEMYEKLGLQVIFNDDGEVVGEVTKKAATDLKPGQVLLLQNTRFRPEEKKNNPDFSKDLASLADIYVDDAFGSCHRAHASTEGIAKYLPAVSGFLIQKELKFIGGALDNPQHPFVAILGGAKVSDKIGVITNLLDKVDTLIIGGGMAYTFYKAQGYEIGTSLLEEDKVDLAADLLKKAGEKGVKLYLPVDNVVAPEFAADATPTVVDSNAMPSDQMGMDIGPKTRELFADVIKNAKTVIWNGPMGVFEFPPFAEGTKAVAKAMAESEATTIIGGGDSAAAVKQLGFADKIDHISTGGGASLEFMEGKVLPGIAVLEDK